MAEFVIKSFAKLPSGEHEPMTASGAPVLKFDGPHDFFCGKCNEHLIESADHHQLTKMTLQCPKCDAFCIARMATERTARPKVRFEPLIEWLEKNSFTPMTARTEYLGDTVRSFNVNIGRVRSFAIFPATMAAHSHLHQLAQDQAMLKVVGSLTYHGSNFPAAKVHAERMKIGRSKAGVKTVSGRTLILSGASNVDDFARENDEAYTAVRALLSSLVIGCWTAFESLAVDLWTAALNEGPKTLSANVISRPVSSTRADGLAPPGGQEKTISLSDLTQFGYDLNSVMGDILRKRKKVDFQSLENTKNAYRAAFGDSFEFTTSSFRELKLIESLRNLYAHRGGVVDTAFQNQTENFPECASAQLGREFPIDGPLCARIIEQTIRHSRWVVEYVDNALTPATNAN